MHDTQCVVDAQIGSDAERDGHTAEHSFGKTSVIFI